MVNVVQRDAKVSPEARTHSVALIRFSVFVANNVLPCLWFSRSPISDFPGSLKPKGINLSLILSKLILRGTAENIVKQLLAVKSPSKGFHRPLVVMLSLSI